jgi:hypothetical protein
MRRIAVMGRPSGVLIDTLMNVGIAKTSPLSSP